MYTQKYVLIGEAGCLLVRAGVARVEALRQGFALRAELREARLHLVAAPVQARGALRALAHLGGEERGVSPKQGRPTELEWA